MNPSESQTPENLPRPSATEAASQQTHEPAGGVTIGNVEGGIHGSIIAGRDVTAARSTPSDRPDQPAFHASAADAYDLGTVRQLLLAAFTSHTLRRFCQDCPGFRPIVAEFGPGRVWMTRLIK